MKILLAIDGSPYGEAAVAEVCRRPWPPHSEVRLLTVEPPIAGNLLHGSAAAIDELIAEHRAEPLERLKKAEEVIQRSAPALPVTPILVDGWAKEVILDEAERWGADLIVVGSHGYGAVKRLFLGSVSHAVATGASCSVLIVRSRDETATTGS